MGNKTAVILMNLGGPDSQAAVGPYIRNLFADPEMIRLPFGPRGRRLFASAIAALRKSSSKRKYALIGGSSPLARITAEQGSALERLLGAQGLDARVFVGMRYWNPTIEEALCEAVETGCDSIVALPLYPQQCTVTTGSSYRALECAVESRGFNGSLKRIESYATHPEYVRAVAQTVRDALAELPADERGESMVLFSAHSIPQKTADGGDPYPAEIRDTVDAVMEQLGDVSHSLSFQSRVGPVRWIGPDTDEELRRLAVAGTKSFVVVPLGFVSDHLETLYDLDIKLREVAQKIGVHHFVRARALNTDESFIRALGELVLDKNLNPEL